VRVLGGVVSGVGGGDFFLTVSGLGGGSRGLGARPT